jgi:hypothetical protein
MFDEIVASFFKCSDGGPLKEVCCTGFVVRRQLREGSNDMLGSNRTTNSPSSLETEENERREAIESCNAKQRKEENIYHRPTL